MVFLYKYMQILCTEDDLFSRYQRRECKYGSRRWTEKKRWKNLSPDPIVEVEFWISLMHDPIIALRGSHGLSAQRAWRTVSSRAQSRPEAPQDRSWAPEGRKTSSVRLILPSSRVVLPWCNNRNQLLESTICGKIVHTIDQSVGLNYYCIGPIAGLVWACKLVYGKNTWQWKLLLFTLLTN